MMPPPGPVPYRQPRARALFWAGALLALLACRPMVCAGAASEDFFAIQVGAYPMQRWADQAAVRYKHQGLYAFVAPTPGAGPTPRYRVYIGKFKMAVKAGDLARLLKERGIVSPASRVKRIDGTRHNQLIAMRYCPPDTGKKQPPKTAQDGRFNSTRQDRPDPAAMHKPGDLSHLQLIRNILGGVAPSEVVQTVGEGSRPADAAPHTRMPAPTPPPPPPVPAADFESDFITTPE